MFRVGKALRKKLNRSHVTWKGYDNTLIVKLNQI